MDLEDKTPQNENRNPIDDFNFLALGMFASLIIS